MGLKERFGLMGKGQRAAAAAAVVVLVAGLGVGGVWAATGGPAAAGARDAAATAAAAAQAASEGEDAATYVVEVGASAPGWDAKTSSPVIARVRSADGGTDFYHAFDANASETVEVGEAGSYEVSYVSPVNSDGSIYEVAKAADVEAVESEGSAAATASAATSTSAAEGAATAASAGSGAGAAAATAAQDGAALAEFKKVEAKDVTADQLSEIAAKVAEAVKAGDATLSGDAGAKVAQKVADNAKANPNADASKVEEQAEKAAEAAKSGETSAKTTAATKSGSPSTSGGKAAAATTSKAGASSGTSAGKGSGSSSSSSTSSSSSSSSSGSSSSGSSSSQQASTPQAQRKWVAEQGHWETTYEQVWVSNIVYTDHLRWQCSECGATFDSDQGIDDHIWGTYKTESHPNGASAINVSYTTQEDKGHYESQATGQKWVVDVAGHWE